MVSFTRLIYWLCIAVISITTCSILLSGWWVGQRYSQAVASEQLTRADYFLDAFLKSEEALHTTSVKGIVTDFGFRRTVADGDPATITSMLENHAGRVGLDLLLILDRDANGLSSFGMSTNTQHLHRLFNLLVSTPNSPRIIALNGDFYWLYLSAVKAPHIVGYVIAGTAIDIDKLEHIQSIVGLDLTIQSETQKTSLSTNSSVEQVIDSETIVTRFSRQRFMTKKMPIPSLPVNDVSLYITADLSDFHEEYDHFSMIMLSITLVLVACITLSSVLISKRMFMPFERLHKRLLYRASHDHMTGLLNRITSTERFHQLHLEAYRKQESLLVALIDIDHFKKVNDTYGHAAGDYLLVEVAERLRSVVREYDVLGRFGGEEFIFVATLPLTDAKNILLRLKNSINDKPLIYRQHSISMTVSIGACFSELSQEVPVEGRQQLVECSDKALYEAKAQGRNQIVIKSQHLGNETTEILY